MLDWKLLTDALALVVPSVISSTHSQQTDYGRYDPPPRGSYTGGGGWNRPVSIAQLVVSILALGVTVIGSIFFDRLATERRMTEITERQTAVLNTHLPQLRAELIDLRSINHEQDRIINALNERLNTQRLEFLEYVARNPGKYEVNRFRGNSGGP